VKKVISIYWITHRVFRPNQKSIVK